MSDSPADLQKYHAAHVAAAMVRDGMIVGLGTGSTAAHLVRILGKRVAEEGLRFTGVPTSEATLRQALSLDIPMLTPDEVERIDLTIDGADEVDPQFRLIKGAGGALLREKIVAAASDDYVIIADEAKPVDMLGSFPLPVEVVPFGMGLTARKIEAALAKSGCAATRTVLRNKPTGGVYVTDGGNNIFDCHCERIPNAETLADLLAHTPGVVEHGLFIGMANTLIVGTMRGAEVKTRT